MFRIAKMTATLLVAASMTTNGQPGVPQLAAAPEILLAGEGVEYIAPVWSPDGSRIAFSSGAFSGLWTFDVRDGQVSQITDEPGAGFGFSWSPDGAALAARVTQIEGVRRSHALKLFDLDEEREVLLTDYRSLMPAVPTWTGDASRVLLFSRGQLEVFDTGRQPDLSKVTASAPSFVLRNLQLARFDPRSGGLMALGPFQGARVVEAVPSPDKTRIAVRVVGEGLFVVRTDGSGVVPLGDGNQPGWSPDGRWIVFSRIQDDGHDVTGADLYIVSAEGGTPIPLTSSAEALEMYPTWSPEGDWIVYADRGTLYRAPIEMP